MSSSMKSAVKVLVLLNILCGCFAKTADKDKCYVLALEGGGDKGAYQVGALKGLVDNVSNNETQWDVVTGVSVGSLNAAGLSIFEIGKEQEAVDYMLSAWRDIKGNRDIFQNWWGGPLAGLFLKTGLYDTTPSRNKLESIIKNNDMKRKFICGATNFVTGVFETWNDETLYRSEYEGAILSSGAYPVVFPINQFRDNHYMDGGVKISVDISSGINKCLDMGYSDENIIADVILLNSKVLPEQEPSGVHPLGVLTRVFEIFGYDNAMRDIEYALIAFPKVNFRYVVSPTKKLPSGSIPLTFSPDDIEKMIGYGIEDGKNIVAMGEGANFDKLIREYRGEREELLGRRIKSTGKN